MRKIAVPGAVLLSLIVAGQVLAATWSTPFPLTSSGVGVWGDLAGLGSGRALVAYTDDDPIEQVYARYTTNAGAGWSTPVLLEGNGAFPAAAGLGLDADVVYNTANGRVWYTHSDDGGAGFDPPVAISPAGRYGWRPAVARGPGGIVSVVWEDVVNGNVYVRVSHDGGDSFDAADLLTMNGAEYGVATAIGEGVIYVAYTVGDDNLRVRRSTNEGTSWSSPTEVTNTLWDDGISMTAVGSHAYLAYTAPNTGFNFGLARYRRTLDSGAHWSGQMNLSPTSWSASEPDVALNGGVLRAVFTRCTPEFDICVDERVFYRQSTNGTSWGTPQRVSPNNLFSAYGPQVAHSQKTITFYVADDSFVRVRNP